jgi:hypothetical protein
LTGHRANEAIHHDRAILTYQQAVFARRHHWAISGRSHHGRLPAHVRHRRHAMAHARAAIVGGTETPIEQIPWQVAVFAEFEVEVAGKKEKVRLLCGGSIVDTTHVVTAGHCAFNPVTELRLPPSSFEVVAGASSITKEALEKSATVQKQLVEGVRIHPYFNYLAETGADDIAVLQLKAPLTLSGAAVKAIGLPASTSAPPEGAGVSVSGYGEETASAEGEPSGKLYSLGLALLFPRRCGGEADALFLCAASGAGSACFGDSGGPVTSALPLTLVGVIDTGEPLFPGGPCASGTINGFVNLAAPEIKDFLEGSEQPPPAPRGGGVVIRGVSVVGHSLTCTPGTWTNNPTFTYDFINSVNRQLLQRGESATYALSEADVDRTIYCEVEASNAGGTGLGRTLALAPIKPAPPPQPVPGPPAAAPGPPAAGVLSSTAASVGVAQLAALLKRELTPSGKVGKIAALLKSGGLTILFQALEAGTVVINWYQVPPGAKLARKAKPVLVASGRATFSAAGEQKIKLKLTSAGERLLKRARSLKLTAKGSFTPTGEAPVTATKAFVLKR